MKILGRLSVRNYILGWTIYFNGWVTIIKRPFQQIIDLIIDSQTWSESEAGCSEW